MKININYETTYFFSSNVPRLVQSVMLHPTECTNQKELTELATDWSNRYGVLPKPVESLILLMKLKLLAKKCGFNKIKLKKPNIIIETRLRSSTFKLIKKALPKNIQNKFYFEEDDLFSKIIIRGLGVTDIQNQIDQLIYWLGLFVNEINNFDKNTTVTKN